MFCNQEIAGSIPVGGSYKKEVEMDQMEMLAPAQLSLITITGRY